MACALHESALGAIPEDEVLNARARKRHAPGGLRIGSVTVLWHEGVLSIRTPTEHHVLNKTQAAELLSYLYDQRGAAKKAAVGNYVNSKAPNSRNPCKAGGGVARGSCQARSRRNGPHVAFLQNVTVLSPVLLSAVCRSAATASPPVRARMSAPLGVKAAQVGCLGLVGALVLALTPSGAIGPPAPEAATFEMAAFRICPQCEAVDWL